MIAVHKIPVLRTLPAVVMKEPREKRRFLKRIKAVNPIGKAILASKTFHKEAKKPKKDKEIKGGEVDFSEDYWGKIRGE